MKYLPLIGAGLARRPVHPILTAIAMAFAACLAALASAVGRVLPPSAELNAGVQAIHLRELLRERDGPRTVSADLRRSGTPFLLPQEPQVARPAVHMKKR